MSHTSGGVTYVMTCGDNTYYRTVKKASDSEEKSFRLDAMSREAKSSGLKQNQVRSGRIQQKNTPPTHGIDLDD
jgi:hypothetical protein